MRVIDRSVVYTGQIPLAENWLDPQRAAVVGLASMSEAVIGRATTIDGLVVSPTAPTSLAVNVGIGSIYALASLDAQAYGSLPADTAHSIVKQGIQLDPLRIPIAPPGTPGFSQTFLLQANFQEVDAGATVLPYYNSANPSQAWAGPSNSGAQQYTRRNGSVVVQVKAGSPAATGSQQTPQPDAGWVGLAWVTVASGQAVILQQHITTYTGPHRITRKLPALGRIVGGAVTVVTGARNLTVDEAGLVILDLGSWSDDQTIRLPSISGAPGEPMRFMFSGRYLTPRPANRRVLSWGRILPSPGDTLEKSFHFVGPNDTIELVSDGASRWLMVRGKVSQTATFVAAGSQSIPSGVSTNVTFAPPGADVLPEWWTAATPTRVKFDTFGRYRLSAGVSFIGGADAGYREFKIVANGATAGPPFPWISVPFVPGASTILSGSSGSFGAYDGDWIELSVLQTSGAPLTLDPARTYLNIEVVTA